MDKLFNKKICFLILAFNALLLPHSAFAANVYLETAHTEFFLGDTVLIDVKIDSENKEINAVEGKISLEYLPDTVLIRDISLSGSSFPLWPGKPSLSEDLKTISFVGGVPSGLTSRDATLFKIALNLKNTGQIILNPADISVYLNDGKGTKDVINTQNLALNVLPQETDYEPINELEILISGDKTPPEPFEVVAGQDDSVFDGKKFLSFSTVDEQSGIKYYKVKEGDLPPVRSNGTYVLQNQDTPTRVTVVAYDAAGNARESVYDSEYPYFNLAVIIALIALLLVVVGFVVKKRKKNDFVQK